MRPRHLALLAIVTVAVSAAAVWASYDRRQTGGGLAASGEPMFPSLNAAGSALQRLEITAPSYQLALELRDGAWIAPERGDFPVEAATANRLVSDLAAFRTWEGKTARADWYPRIGVADVGTEGSPADGIRLVGADGTDLADVIVGLRSDVLAGLPHGGTFVRRPGEAQAWLVGGTVTVPGGLGEWIGPAVEIPGPSVLAISVFEGDRVLLHAEKDAEAVYHLTSADPAAAGAEVDDAALKALSRGVVAARPVDVAPLAAVDFGANARAVAFATDTGVTVRATLGDLDGETWIAFRAEASDEAAQAQADEINARTADWAFLLAPKDTAVFQVPLDGLIAAPK